MKKNIFIGLLLISMRTVFSAAVVFEKVETVASRAYAVFPRTLDLGRWTMIGVGATATGLWVTGYLDSERIAKPALGVGGILGFSYGWRDTARLKAYYEEQGKLKAEAERVPMLEEQVKKLTNNNTKLTNSFNVIKTNTGLHALAFLGVSYTKNETDELLLSSPYIPEDKKKQQLANINRQQKALRATAQILLNKSSNVIDNNIKDMLPIGWFQ